MISPPTPTGLNDLDEDLVVGLVVQGHAAMEAAVVVEPRIDVPQEVRGRCRSSVRFELDHNLPQLRLEHDPRQSRLQSDAVPTAAPQEDESQRTAEQVSHVTRMPDCGALSIRGDQQCQDRRRSQGRP